MSCGCSCCIVHAHISTASASGGEAHEAGMWADGYFSVYREDMFDFGQRGVLVMWMYDLWNFNNLMIIV